MIIFDILGNIFIFISISKDKFIFCIILLMEIYTTNLFNVNVEETKLQNNFVVIDKILKGFQMQLSQFSVQQ